ncbi:MAG: peptide chain release factor N(5)-glutamine methyltransferase [Dermatophilaceae bacterium]
MTGLREAVRAATQQLAQAGVASAPVDALVLAAHALEISVSEARRLLVLDGPAPPESFADLVAERVRRVPLQHLTGEAHFRQLTLAVGPGVFVPRPETETLVSLALAAIAQAPNPVVVDLASGSGVIAFAIKQECPHARVYAAEADPGAHAWAELNRSRLGLDVELTLGDGRAAYPLLERTVDLVTCNPPYVPDGATPRDPEVRDHDPALALYGGPDGLTLPAALAARAAQLLRAGGVLVMEHGELQGPALLRRLAATGDWRAATDHADLTGRPRVVVAERSEAPT